MIIDYSEVFGRILKYLIEGIAVGLVSYFVAQLNTDQIIIIAVSSAAIFAILDMYSPGTGNAFRMGIGLSAGTHMVGIKTV